MSAFAPKYFDVLKWGWRCDLRFGVRSVSKGLICDFASHIGLDLSGIHLLLLTDLIYGGASHLNLCVEMKFFVMYFVKSTTYRKSISYTHVVRYLHEEYKWNSYWKCRVSLSIFCIYCIWTTEWILVTSLLSNVYRGLLPRGKAA